MRVPLGRGYEQLKRGCRELVVQVNGRPYYRYICGRVALFQCWQSILEHGFGGVITERGNKWFRVLGRSVLPWSEAEGDTMRYFGPWSGESPPKTTWSGRSYRGMRSRYLCKGSPDTGGGAVGA